MKAYMLCDFNNPVSMQYTEIALESWENTNIFDIELVQCYTPNTIDELESNFNWKPLLSTIQIGSESTSSERAGDISHWEMIRKRAESNERFFVMEHDAYLLDEDRFKEMFDFTIEHDLDYSNLGLFMSCYSFSKEASWGIYDLLTNKGFPLNGGPFGCVERLVKTYMDRYPSDKQYRFMTHGHSNNVDYGTTSRDLHFIYNSRRTDHPIGKVWKHRSGFTIPSTQVISKSVGITQEHTYGSKSKMLYEKPWHRSPYFKIID